MARLIEEINRIVARAGTIALEHFGHVAVERKSDNTIVTQADRQIEELLSREFERLIPGSAFVGEEGSGENHDTAAEFVWIVDPIDGTAAYAAGLPIWGISVALFRDGRPFLGAAAFPGVNSRFWNDEDGRAFWNDRQLPLLQPEKAITPETFICVPSNTHYRYGIDLRLKGRSLGSTVYHILIAAQDIAYATLLGYPSLWDIAGGVTIAQCVGAQLFTLPGEPFAIETMLRKTRKPEPLLLTQPGRLSTLAGKIRRQA